MTNLSQLKNAIENPHFLQLKNLQNYLFEPDDIGRSLRYRQ